jgi:hypothetical protein
MSRRIVPPWVCLSLLRRRAHCINAPQRPRLLEITQARETDMETGCELRLLQATYPRDLRACQLKNRSFDSLKI